MAACTRLLAACALLALSSVPLAAAAARTAGSEAALARARTGDIDGAVELAKTAARAAPTVADAAFVEGQLLCAQAQSGSKLKALGRARACRDAFARAVRLDPASIDANSGLVEFHLQAPGIAGGDRKIAAQTIAATREPTPALHAFLLGIEARSRKDLKGAEAHYLRAIALAPDEPRFSRTLISGYVEQKRFAEAFAVIDAGLARNVQDPQLRYQLARTAAISGQRAAAGLAQLDALGAHEVAKAGLPPAGIAFRRGMLLADLGRTDDARAAFARAKQLDAQIAPQVDPELAKLPK